jgi:RecA/RadA recombinase
MTTNDAAERLIDAAIQQAYDKGKAAGAADERRATVERIRAAVSALPYATPGMDAILDAEAER